MHARRNAAESELVTEPEKALKRLRRQLVLNSAISDEQSAALDDLLLTALKEAGETEEQTLTVMNPVSRPQQLRLAVIAEDRQLDTMYGKEFAQLAISEDGVCYLVYRRSDGGDYAVSWSPASALAPTTMQAVPELLLLAMMGGTS